MKKLLVLLVVTLMLGGCAKQAVQAPFPGAINSFDQVSYQTLMDTQAAINAVKADVASGKVTLTATQKSVLNQAIQDYDLAQAAWQAYHSGATSDTVGLTNAIDQIVADIAALASKIQSGGK
jgi:lysozyme family protein